MLGIVSKIYTGLLRIVIASAIITGARGMDIRGMAESSRVAVKGGLLQFPRLSEQ
jgi:hypothetical protein